MRTIGLDLVADLIWKTELDVNDLGNEVLAIYHNEVGSFVWKSICSTKLRENDMLKNEERGYIVAYAVLSEKREDVEELYKTILEKENRRKQLEENFNKMKNEDKYHYLNEQIKEINF